MSSTEELDESFKVHKPDLKTTYSIVNLLNHMAYKFNSSWDGAYSSEDELSGRSGQAVRPGSIRES